MILPENLILPQHFMQQGQNELKLKIVNPPFSWYLSLF